MEKDTYQFPTKSKFAVPEHMVEWLAQVRELIAQKREDKKHKEEAEGVPVPELRPGERLVSDFFSNKEIGVKIETMLSADEHDSNELLLRLGEEFLKTVEIGYPTELKAFMDEGFPVTWQDPNNGLTVLHIAAASQSRKILRFLIKTGKCDFLLRDNHGRLASEMAYLYGEDVAIARLLGNKERKQAEAQGIKLTRRPKPE